MNALEDHLQQPGTKLAIDVLAYFNEPMTAVDLAYASCRGTGTYQDAEGQRVNRFSQFLDELHSLVRCGYVTRELSALSKSKMPRAYVYTITPEHRQLVLDYHKQLAEECRRREEEPAPDLGPLPPRRATPCELCGFPNSAVRRPAGSRVCKHCAVTE